MTEQEAAMVLDNFESPFKKDLTDAEREAIQMAIVALRRGDTLAISHGWTPENIEAASLGVTTQATSLDVTTRTPGDWQIYSMKEKKWLE
jgi:hypothetical protein